MSEDIEIWCDVPSYPGVEASSWGRVRRKPKTAPLPNGGWREYKSIGTYGVVVSSKKGAKHKYRRIMYRDHGNIKIHRAVCEAFHGPAPPGKNVVIHRDEDALNNRPENLKWGTQKENLNAPGFIEYCKGRTGANSPTTKAKNATC